MSEFEHYLETQVGNQQQKKDEGPSRKKQSNDEFWEGVLQSELQRVAALENARLVPVEEMMVGAISDEDDVPIVPVEERIVCASSDEDDVPIVQTLTHKSSQLALLATLAATSGSSPKPRKKKTPKSLWSYVTVNEPTGVSSNYWDTDAPTERRTKQLAKEKISALHEGDGKDEGTLVHCR